MCGQKAIFSLFLPILNPHRATFGHILGFANGPDWSFWMFFLCSKIVSPLPAYNRPSGPICVAKRLFLAYFSSFLAPVGPHLEHSRSGKLAKLINLDVLSVFPTFFQSVPLHRGSHMAIILKLQILALWGRFKGLNMRNGLTSSWNGGHCI